MLEKKIKTMKFSDIIAVTKPTYRYLKVIPHLGIRNYSSDELVAFVNNMYKNLFQRVKRENKKLIVESKCKLTYYIHITPKDVEFFFIVPEYYMDLIKNKIAQCWGNKVNLIEVEDIPKFRDDCSKVQINYKNLDGFSIAVNKANNDLLESNLAVMSAMQENDSVGILYNMMPITPRQQRTWITRYDEDIEKFKLNGNIEKLILDPSILIKLAFVSFIKIADSFIKDIQSALRDNNIQIKALENINLSITNNKKLSNPTLRKRNDTIVKTQIACISQSDDKLQQEKLLNNIVNSFEVVKEDNQFISRPIKSDFKLEDYNYNINTLNCSDKELGANSVVLPGTKMLKQYSQISKNEITEIKPPAELLKGYINLGTYKYKSDNFKTYFNTDKSLINLPIALLGASRSGKSTLAENMCKDIIEAGEGLIILDFIKNTEFCDNVRKITPANRLIDLDLTDPNCYQAFSYNELKITDDMTDQEKIKIANRKVIQIANLIDSINEDGKTLTGKMRRYLVSAGKVMLLENNKTLKDIIRFLQNHVYRHKIRDNLSSNMKSLLADDLGNLNEIDEIDKKELTVTGTKDSKIEGILDRITLIESDPNMNLIYNIDDSNNIDFAKEMNAGKVILIRLKEEEYFEKLSKNVMVTYFITKIWLASLIRNKGDVRRCTVIVDEIFQVPMAQKLVGKQLVQSAKFNLKYVLTLHYLNQLTTDTQEALKSANSSYVLISGCDKKAFRDLEEEFEEYGYTLGDLIKLERFHALNLIKASKGYASFITKLPPPIWETNHAPAESGTDPT